MNLPRPLPRRLSLNCPYTIPGPMTVTVISEGSFGCTAHYGITYGPDGAGTYHHAWIPCYILEAMVDYHRAQMERAAILTHRAKN